MSLFNDPVEWAENTVGKRYKLFSICAIHIVLGFTAIIVSGNSRFDGAMTSGILMFGVAFPCMYLYALKGVLDKYKQLAASGS